ncbi:unnamed protein product [Phytophthora fragariaefolia]|uniref:Unnamed protein product n=1 Tax=Phytophthora fragariaefolia TaxID=1490495 RepID=A0A9W6XFF7_9STRA|nr:unnamed protein product [Phytophthora fragariaefolia]
MTVLIDSGASFNFATNASVARSYALIASAFEASKSKTNESVRLATGSIVSTRKVTLPLSVKFDDFNSIEPFIVLDMDDRYDLILGIPWIDKHEPWIDWRSRTIGTTHNPLADRALAAMSPPLPETGLCMSTVCHAANGSLPGLLNSWTANGIASTSAGARARGAILCRVLDSLKAAGLTEAVLLRSEGSSLVINSSSVMDSEVLEDERSSKRQTRYGAAILKNLSDPYYGLLQAFSDVSDVVSGDPPSAHPPNRGGRHEIDLVLGTKYCITR